MRDKLENKFDIINELFIEIKNIEYKIRRNNVFISKMEMYNIHSIDYDKSNTYDIIQNNNELNCILKKVLSDYYIEENEKHKEEIKNIEKKLNELMK